MFDRTAALLEKTLEDLKKISFWVTILIQVIFAGMNAYKAVVNIDRTLYFVLYVVLGSIALFNLIFFVASYSNKKSSLVIGTKKIVRFVKYFFNAAAIVLIIVEYVNVGASKLDVILSIISIASFVGQIVFEIVRYMIGHYAALFKIAIAKDMEKLKPITDTKGSIIRKAGSVFGSIADKIHGAEPKEEMSQDEKDVEALAEDYKKRKEEKKREKTNSEKEIAKRNFKRIFGVKNKNEEE